MKSLKGKVLLLLFTVVWAIIWLLIGVDRGMQDTGKCYMGQENYCPAQYCSLGK